MATEKHTPATVGGHPTNSGGQSATADLAEFVRREQRRTERLVRAAYGVGGPHAWFRALLRPEQAAKVREWAEEALMQAAARRAGLGREWAEETADSSCRALVAGTAR